MVTRRGRMTTMSTEDVFRGEKADRKSRDMTVIKAIAYTVVIVQVVRTKSAGQPKLADYTYDISE